MRIRKKNGDIEEYDINKIKRSIGNSAEDYKIMLTESDLSNICKDIDKVIKAEGKEETSSYEVFGVVIFKLHELNYSDVLDSYFKGALDLEKK